MFIREGSKFFRIVYCADRVSWMDRLRPCIYQKCYSRKFYWGTRGISTPSQCVDLLQSAEAIFSGFKSNTRNEINRAKKEGLLVEYHVDWKQVFELHQIMAEEKHLPMPSENTYNGWGGHLECTVIRRPDSVAPLVGHAYILDPEHGRVFLHTSVSAFRNMDPDERKLVGFANRYLHYMDMLHFRESGYTGYDFGGYPPEIAPDDPRWNINKFKDSFGGKMSVYHRYITYPALLLSRVKKAIGK